jgi:type III restriction enzyme
MGYVFTSSNDFQQTISCIIEGLQNSGYSARDYRSAEIEETYTETRPVQLGLFDSFDADATEEVEEETDVDADSVDTQAIKEALQWEAENDTPSETVEKVLNTAIQQSFDFSQMFADSKEETDDNSEELPRAMTKDRKTTMREQFRDKAEAIRLPIFHIVRENVNKIFSDSDEEFTMSKLERENLYEGFNLDLCTRDIEVSAPDIEVQQIDITEGDADEFVPKAWSLDEKQMNEFKQYVKTLAVDGKIQQLTNKISRSLNYDFIPQASLDKYVKETLSSVSTVQLEQLTDNVGRAIALFKQKIGDLLTAYATTRFNQLCSEGNIRLAYSYALPKGMTVACKSGRRIVKSLYREEEAFNAKEAEVISAIASLPAVEFWHRNQEHGRGYCINGVTPHYPDFIVKLKSGTIVLIEVQADAASAEATAATGLALEQMAQGIRYFSVGDDIDALKKAIEG